MSWMVAESSLADVFLAVAICGLTDGWVKNLSAFVCVSYLFLAFKIGFMCVIKDAGLDAPASVVVGYL